jgi:hypothetical protein
MPATRRRLALEEIARIANWHGNELNEAHLDRYLPFFKYNEIYRSFN